MKTGNRALVLLLAGVFILLCCVIAPGSLVEKGMELNGDCGFNKVVVTARKQTGLQSNPGLLPGDVGKLAGGLGIKEYTYNARPAVSRAPVEAGGASVVSRITGTNHMLPLFCRMNLLYGAFFTETAVREGACVAVIDDRLAWNAFKTWDAVGKTLEIYGIRFKIVGVVKRDVSILSNFADDGFPEVFIPGERLFELDDAAVIASFQVRTPDPGTMDNNRQIISGALQQAGKNPSEYNITDFNIKRALLEQKPEVIVFILGSIVILIILLWLRDTAGEIISALRRECGADYLTDVMRRNGGRIGIAAVKALCAAAAILLIVSGIRFRLFIPPAFIPEELIDIRFYFELIKSGIRSGIENQGYMPGTAEMLLDRIDMLTGRPLAIMAAAGLLVTNAGFRRLKPLGIKPQRLSLACGLFILLSLIILAVSAGVSGLTFKPDTGNILVTWVFIYINILYDYYRNEKGRCEND